MPKPKDQSQAADNSGYVPTKIPGVLRLGNKYSRDPNYQQQPEPTAPPVQQAQQAYMPLLKPVTDLSPRPQPGLPTGYNPFTKKNTLGTLPEEDIQLAENAKRPRKLAKGGLVKGPGTATSDSINAKLSKGEMVIPANVVKHFGLGMFKKMIDAAPPQQGAKTSVKEGKMNAAGGAYVNPNEKRSKSLQNPTFLTNMVAPIERGSKALMNTVQPVPQGAVKAIPEIPVAPKAYGMAGFATDNSGFIKDLPQSQLKTRQATPYPSSLDKQTFIPEIYPQNTALSTGSGLGTQGRIVPPVLSNGLLPDSIPTTQPERLATSVNKPPIPETQAGPAGNNGNNGNTQTGQTGALGNNRIDLGGGNYIGDGKPRSPESVATMQGLIKSTPEQVANRAEQAKIVDDRYAWSRNREAERQQAAQAAQPQVMFQQGPQMDPGLAEGIAQAQATLASGDLGGKHAAAQFLNFANERLGTQQRGQQAAMENYNAQMDRQAGRNTQADQYNQNMAWNREQGAALGATEAAKMAQTERLAQEKNNIDTWQPTDTYDPLTGQKNGTRLFNKRTAKYADEEVLAQQKEQAQKTDWDNLQLAIKKNPAKAKEYQQRYESVYGKG